MDTYIIHLESRTDRTDNICELLKIFSDASIYQAISPSWVKNDSMRSVLGCSLSHLDILYNSKSTLVLILEDDAKCLTDFKSINIPEDAGAIIFGGEVPPESVIDGVNGYYKISGQYFGSHAVLYNTRILKSNKFFETAYKIIATHKIGSELGCDITNVGLCYESILAYALKKINVPLYRPKDMLFTTIDSISSRTNAPMGPRSKYLNITNK